MALLTLDRGNTTLDGMWHVTPEVRHRVDPRDAAAVAALVTDGSREDAGRDAASTTAVGVTSVSGALDAVAEILAGRGGRLLLAGRDLPCPLDLDYPDPTTLGADRWVGALAAHRRFGAAITVDCGTAVTVNAVDAAGVFRGGAIAPGARAMAHALATAAPRLPVARLDSQPAMPGRDSIAAVELGVQLGFCGLVERLVAELRRAVHLPDATLVVTGGDAPVFLARTARPVEHRPDLIHQGLRILWEGTRTSS